MYAVIRIRGTASAGTEVQDTLKMLRLNRSMHCVFVKDTDEIKGMLQKAKDLITWGEVSDDVLKSVVDKRARKGGNARLSEKEAADTLKSIKETAKVPSGVKPVFRLTPPSKGFKHSVKQHYPRGELGYRADKINDLLKRMI